MRHHLALVCSVIALSSIACGGGGIGLGDFFGDDADAGRDKSSAGAPHSFDGVCIGTPQSCESADASYLCPDACDWTDSVCAGTPTPCSELDDISSCYEADCDWDTFGPERGQPSCTGVPRGCLADDYDFRCAPGCNFTPGSCTAIVDGCANIDYEWDCEEAGCVWET